MKIIAILFLFPLACFSQFTSGEITYKVSFPVNEILDKTPDFKNAFEELREGIEMVEMKLYFNTKESLFTVVEYKGIGRDKWQVSKSFAVRDYPIYADKKTILFNTIQNNNDLFNDYEFLVNDTYGDWSLENEEKIIDNFKCFKAVKRIETKSFNEEKVFTRIITAWYCSEIPVSFGPKGYGGLPGVILELNENNYKTFYATKVNMVAKEVVIEKPQRGKPIEITEYLKILNARSEKVVLSRG